MSIPIFDTLISADKAQGVILARPSMTKVDMVLADFLSRQIVDLDGPYMGQ